MFIATIPPSNCSAKYLSAIWNKLACMYSNKTIYKNKWWILLVACHLPVPPLDFYISVYSIYKLFLLISHGFLKFNYIFKSLSHSFQPGESPVFLTVFSVSLLWSLIDILKLNMSTLNLNSFWIESHYWQSSQQKQ